MPIPRPQGRGGGSWMLLPILGLVLAGCAQAATQTRAAAAATTTPPALVTVGPNDDGRTVDLDIGDRLAVVLHAAKPPARLPSAWTLRSPASTALKRLPGASTSTRVVFVAEAPGTVQLVLVQRLGCSSPLRCPMVADASDQSQLARPPLSPTVATITIRVR